MAQATRVLLVLCLFVISVSAEFFPPPFQPESEQGFPSLSVEDVEHLNEYDRALNFVLSEDRLSIVDLPDFSVREVIDCLEKPTDSCSPTEKWKNEAQLRVGYKPFGYPCSSDPELNALVLTPPHDTSNVPEYINWQRRILTPNQSLCNPFKQLQCSKTSGKCECPEGLVFDDGPFRYLPAGDNIRLSYPFRERQNICVIPFEKPCGVPEIREMPSYFSIFSQSKDVIRNGGPHCGRGACLRQSYTQREQVCTPWKHSEDGDDRGLYLDIYFDKALKLDLGDRCSIEHHNRLHVFSTDEQSPVGFLAKRRKNLEDLMNSLPTGYGFCDLGRLITCGNSGKCECMFPAQDVSGSCVIYKQCHVTDELSKILENKTWSLSTQKLIASGMGFGILSCEHNYVCLVGLDIDHKIFMYCTCENGKAGHSCDEDLTRFLMFVRVPSFPTDGESINDKREIFNVLNRKAIEFEKLFKLGPGVPCIITAELEAEMTIAKIQELEKKGTVRTKADYASLTQAIDKQIKKRTGLCLRFGAQPLICDMMTAKCVTEDIKNILKRCNHLADIMCDAKEIRVQDGKCVCDATKSPSPSGQNGNMTSKVTSAAPPKSTSNFNVFFILVVFFALN